jgi:hypothetical protein
MGDEFCWVVDSIFDLVEKFVGFKVVHSILAPKNCLELLANLGRNRLTVLAILIQLDESGISLWAAWDG